MSLTNLTAINLDVAADNGLRRGYTTGSCATAAVKAALILWQNSVVVSEVDVTMPDGEHFLTIAIKSVEKISDKVVRACVVKDAGDDPDCTHGATIFVDVEENDSNQIVFKAGAGVGTVTEPGIRVPVGEPAINPGPRQMIEMAISEVFADDKRPGFDITVGCVDGEVLAKKTFNPRLGITGGISILGTTGVVEPMSLAAYMAAIEVYIRVSVAENSDTVAFLPGNIGLRFCKETLNLPKKRVVNISNFLGFSVDVLDETLALSEANDKQKREIKSLYVLGHPGKLAKVLDGQFDLHSSRSGMAMTALAKFWKHSDLSEEVLSSLENANTVEAIVETLSDHPRRKELWSEVEIAIANLIEERIYENSSNHDVHRIKDVQVRLFNMRGVALGVADSGDQSFDSGVPL